MPDVSALSMRLVEVANQLQAVINSEVGIEQIRSNAAGYLSEVRSIASELSQGEVMLADDPGLSDEDLEADLQAEAEDDDDEGDQQPSLA